jgi:hypothetical protein
MPRTVPTTAKGASSFQALPPGTYDGRLIVPGYEDVDLGAITLPMGREPRTLRLRRKQEAGK